MGALIGVFIALAVCLSPAAAGELKVISAVSLKSVLTTFVPQFEKETGNKVQLTLDTSVALKRRVDGGQHFDVAILSPEITESLEHENRRASGVHPVVGRTDVGVASRSGVPKPSVATPDDLKTTLLNARSIVTSDPKRGGASAVQLQKVIQLFGIEEQIRPKLVFTPGGAAPLAVENGKADLAVALRSEIVPVKGVDLAGPFPPKLQRYVTLLGSIAADTSDPDASKAFLQALQSPAAREVLAHSGMDPH